MSFIQFAAPKKSNRPPSRQCPTNSLSSWLRSRSSWLSLSAPLLLLPSPPPLGVVVLLGKDYHGCDICWHTMPRFLRLLKTKGLGGPNHTQLSCFTKFVKIHLAEAGNLDGKLLICNLLPLQLQIFLRLRFLGEEHIQHGDVEGISSKRSTLEKYK